MQEKASRVSVIDLGTNTFHIVIFEKQEDGEINEIYRKRFHVFLSKDGIEKIGKTSMASAKNAILAFQQTIKTYQPDTLQIIGTAALRRASNGFQLKQFIEEKLQTEVQVISGKREAELIAKGVQWELKSPIENAIIMDIGGGSVEFIHVKNNAIAWLQSFPMGVGVLYNAFGHEHKITKEDIFSIKEFIEQTSPELCHYLDTVSIDHLIGCSGSFELIPSILEGQYPPEDQMGEVDLSDFFTIRNTLWDSSYETRLLIEGLPQTRARLVNVAFVLMDWFIEKAKIQSITISKYAVKEGLVAEILGEA